ncbi:MAG TPA: Gfo/Idh/MocA family oxidoreductase, partial [Longimicrobiales bacterium]|nr:Gfo/Idh/MocA family oxidoreductase [Longimicrobiales bacterium]
MSRRLRWGVLSTANIGRRAVNPAIQASSNGELVSVASRDPERARAFAADHGIPRAAASYEALLDDPEIDALYIPLPNALHREWTV